LELAKSIGAIPINFTMSDPVAMIEALRSQHAGELDILLPGEEKMKRVMCGIDAVGYQARDRNDPSKENPTQVISDLVKLINPTGHLGMIGVYTADDPGAASQHAKKGESILPFGQLWEKGMTVGTGQTPVKKLLPILRDMIIAGVAKPSFIISHKISIEEAPAAYREFAKRAEGFTKVTIQFEK
jgi:glutathione-independent formaldehyde dehydrogenase